MDIKISQKQKLFIDAAATEVLFGGAAGGGKSYAQVIDALLFALKYPASKQILFRRTFPELEKSIIRTVLNLYPQDIMTYNNSQHTVKFKNGSLLDFAYIDNDNHVNKYQSAEYDVIRFDELTHFTEYMYTYMLSRLRGANNYPKQMKSSTNPGSVGHSWVKSRFIDSCIPNETTEFENGSRIFIPSKVTDNKFLLDADPNYIKRLMNLSEKDQKALLQGDWDIFDGQYFPEFNRELHVIRPFTVPTWWRFYRVFDYGLDMLAAYIIAVDTFNNAYVIHEIHESNLIISDAAKKMLDVPWDIYCTFAPPDLWGRSQESGKSRADIFADNSLMMVKSRNERVAGWMAVKEYLKPVMNEMGEMKPKLFIFEHCRNLIAHLPAIQIDEKNPDDCANEPHDITHSCDALRGFCIMRPIEAIKPPDESWKDEDWEDDLDSFINFGG